MSTMFPGLNGVPENADKFAAQEFSPNCSNSMPFSIQANNSGSVGGDQSGQFTVMGSNLSANVADMVNVKDESGASGPMPVNGGIFVKNFFPFKYIGIQYTHNTNSGSGTISLVMEQRPTKITLG